MRYCAARRVPAVPQVGFGKAEATLVVAALALVTFLTAYPLGRLDDK